MSTLVGGGPRKHSLTLETNSIAREKTLGNRVNVSRVQGAWYGLPVSPDARVSSGTAPRILNQPKTTSLVFDQFKRGCIDQIVRCGRV
jgi:hypothetical protein